MAGISGIDPAPTFQASLNVKEAFVWPRGNRLDGKAVLGDFFKACSGKGLRVVVPGEAT